jgi:hypothetical protein
MSLVKRPPASLQSDMDIDDALDRRYNYDNDEDIDPELRLRTVRTAHSAIAESIVADTRYPAPPRALQPAGTFPCALCGPCGARGGLGPSPRWRCPRGSGRRWNAARRPRR